MNYKQLKRMKVLITSFISATVAISLVYNNILLSFAGVFIGIIFLMLVRKKTKVVLVDERIETIGGKTAQLTYTISTITIALLSLIFTTSGRQSGEIGYEMLGVFLSYITLFNLALYSISFKFISKKYGESDDE